MAEFDPYRKWLGIPEDSRPPSHYQLLGISPEERDQEVINAACVRQSAYVRNFQTGKYADDATRILTEIAAAKACLTDVMRRAAYDLELKKKQPKPAESAPARARTGESGEVARPRGTRSVSAPAAPPAGAPPAPRPPAFPSSAPLAGAPTGYPPGFSGPVDPAWGQQPMMGMYPGQPMAPFLRPAPPSFRIQGWHIAAIGGIAVAVGVLITVLVVTSGRDNEADPSAAVASQGASETGVSPVVDPQAGAGQGAVASAAVSGDPQPIASTPDPVTAGAATEPDDTSSASPAGARTSPRRPAVPWTTGERAISIPNPQEFAPIIAPGNRFLALDGECWDLTTGESVGRCWTAGLAPKAAALSPNGKWFAASASEETDAIDLQETEPGQGTKSLPFEFGTTRLEMLAFADDTYLVACWRGSRGNRVQLWDIETAKVVAEFDTDEFERKHAALSPDGKYLAIVLRESVLIYEVRKRKKVATAVPSDGWLIGCDGIAFAPNGQEVALVTNGGRKIMAWSGNAELVYDVEPKADLRGHKNGAFYGGPAIAYLPDGSGWLVYGHNVFDRSSHQVLVQVSSSAGGAGVHQFLDQDRLLVTRGEGASRDLADLTIPWDQIRRARDAKRRRTTSGGPSITLAVSANAAGTGGSAAPALERALSERLEAEGYRIGNAEVGQMVAEYREATEQRQVLVFGPNGQPTFAPGGGFQTQTLSVIVGTLTLSLVPPGGGEPLWSDVVTGTNERFPGPQTQAPSTALDRVVSALARKTFPVFLPDGGELVTLPLALDASL
jgi:hypothetical protein